MALLASCWLLVESFIVPHGPIKWFYLRFYINPLFLVFCQIFLWLEGLKRLIFVLLVSFPLRISLFIFRFVNGLVLFLSLSFSTRQRKVDVLDEAVKEEIPCVVTHDSGVVISLFQSGVCPLEKESGVGSNPDTCNEDSWLDEYLSSDHFTSSLLTCDDLDSTESLLSDEVLLDQNRSSFSSSCTDQETAFSSLSELRASDSSIINQGLVHEPDQDSEISCDHELLQGLPCFNVNDVYLSITDDHSCTLPEKELLVDQRSIVSRSVQEGIDPFHHKYTERMRFFDVLYHERLCGMNAILNEHLMSPGSRSDFTVQQHMSLSRIARNRLLRSLECDFELIYVAQSCLFWEALRHQYQKVDSLTSSDKSENELFHHSVSGKFQELQILFERFVENQKCERHKSSNDIHTRLSFQCLLQVPHVTEFMEDVNNGMGGEERIRASEVVKAIEKCMKAFWSYIQTDEKKCLWKYKGIWRSHPPVEDPLDLELLHNVAKALHKKGILLKDVQGKKKCWLRRKAVKPVHGEDDKRNDLAVAMVEMRLVQRVLKMSLISRSQLKWCQQKLDNLEFRHGEALTSHLFPSF